MNFRKGQSREDPEINLIPFIDVLLVILIFMMVTTTYSKFTELKITLPTADAAKAQERPDDLNVAVDAKGNYTVNNVPVSFRDVAAILAEAKGIEVPYTVISDQEYIKGLVAKGFPAVVAVFLHLWVTGMSKGEWDEVTPDLKTLLGREPLTPAEFFAIDYPPPAG